MYNTSMSLGPVARDASPASLLSRLRYRSAPLPFQGQKRFFLTDFVKRMAQLEGVRVVVDVFGGSGLLSVACRDVLRSDVRVVYNDYDHYADRVRAIDLTREIQNELHNIIGDVKTYARLSQDEHNAVLAVLKKYKDDPRADWRTVSAWLLYTFNIVSSYDELARESCLYNRLPKSDLRPAADYLRGLEVVHEDWRDVMREYKDVEGVFFVLDPPYLCTQQGAYAEYWRLDDYLDLVSALPPRGYAYFGSEKSDFVKILDWGAAKLGWHNPLSEAERVERVGSRSRGLTYKELMMFSSL